MTLIQFIRLILRNWLIIALFPLMLAAAVFYLSKQEPKEYESTALVYTSMGGSKSIGSESIRLDYYTTNNMFDNMVLMIKSRETIEQVSLKLLSQHLSLREADPTIISKESYDNLKIHINDTLWNKLAVYGDADSTYANVKRIHNAVPINSISYLMRDHHNYGLSKILERLRANRKASSDMMELVYRTNDPGICKHTLDYILEVFMKKYAGLKEEENINAIRYFEEQLKSAKDKLDDAEARIKSFISSNNILNFYEQGKYLDIAYLEYEKDEDEAKRIKAGTESNIEQIEELFDMYSSRTKVIDELIGLQKLLISKSNELESLSVNPTVNKEKIRWLKEDIKEVQQQITQRTDKVFEISTSKEGIPRNTILEEWLKLKIEYEQQLSSLEVMKDRKSYLYSKISSFAPLGAELKKLEREVTVNEGQYLSILHGLNMAYLKKYDLEMTSNQQVIDEPFYPIDPLPSKKKLIVAGSYVAGLFLVLFMIIGRRLLDDRINSLDRAIKFTGLHIGGMFPNTKYTRRGLDKKLLLDSLKEQFLGQVVLKQEENIQSINPPLIIIYSNRKKEGKTFIADILARELAGLNAKVLLMAQISKTPVSDDVYDVVNYNDDRSLIKTKSIDELISKDIAIQEYDYIIMILPAMLNQSLPEKIIEQTSLSIMVLNTNRKWNILDDKLKEYFSSVTSTNQILVLNKMHLDYLEEGYGEFPSKKTWYKRKQDNFSIL